MEIGKIIAIGLVGTIFAVLLKKENPQLAMLLAAVTGILIFGIIWAACRRKRRTTASGQCHPQHRELLRCTERTHPAGAPDQALRRQPAAQRADRGYAGRAGSRQPSGAK